MGKQILDIIIENADRRLDEIMFQNPEYRKANQNMEQSFKKLEKVGLTKKQDRAVDQLLSAYNAENACCCRILYRQGFQDCISLLKEIGIIS